MRLLFVGDFNVTRGTGYATILSNVCTELAGMGHDVTVLGDSWDRSEHYYPFRVIPTDYGWIPVHVLRLHQALDFDHVILSMDVPKLVQVLDEVERQELAWPSTSGLFPIESDPLVSVWANGLARLQRRLVISEFGQMVLAGVGLDSVFVPMTANVPERRVAMPEARQALKDCVMWGDPDLLDGMGPMILTVADNQERKDLPVIGQALDRIAQSDKVKYTWLLVTMFHSPYGWYLPDVLERIGMAERTLVFDALSADDLSRAYYAADLFVIASQAEGACLPLYEAMAHDLPCVAPAHTAISEALMDGRGSLVHMHSRTIHPWGSVNRYHTDVEQLAGAVMNASNVDNGRYASDFIKSRPWSLAAQRIEEGLKGGKEKRNTRSVQARQGAGTAAKAGRGGPAAAGIARGRPGPQANGGRRARITDRDVVRSLAQHGRVAHGAMDGVGAAGAAGRIQVRPETTGKVRRDVHGQAGRDDGGRQ